MNAQTFKKKDKNKFKLFLIFLSLQKYGCVFGQKHLIDYKKFRLKTYC